MNTPSTKNSPMKDMKPMNTMNTPSTKNSSMNDMKPMNTPSTKNSSMKDMKPMNTPSIKKPSCSGTSPLLMTHTSNNVPAYSCVSDTPANALKAYTKDLLSGPIPTACPNMTKFTPSKDTVKDSQGKSYSSYYVCSKK
jgi:hypothetical protein